MPRFTLLGRAAGAASILIVLPVLGCADEEVAGCWLVEDESESVSLFLDTETGEALGRQEWRAHGGEPVQIDVEGEWSATGDGEYRVDAACSSAQGNVRCGSVARWSLSCSLQLEDRLSCVGSPFSARTTLSTCPDNATVGR